MEGYQEFVRRKTWRIESTGETVPRTQLPDALFDFQRDIVTWAIRKGRAAIFSGCGTGKTLMQLTWAMHQPTPVLFIAPICVAEQTIGEAKDKLGMTIRHYGEGGDYEIVNYEALHHVDPSRYRAVVLDESSILKGLNSKTRSQVTRMFAATPRKLCCTATPAPNDITELANHAEFLGIASRAEMLATWFVHDENGWRLKGHAATDFYRWLASWAMFLSHPSDLGYQQDGFDLPPLEIIPVIVEAGQQSMGGLPGLETLDLRGRQQARAGSVALRVQRANDLICGDEAQWLVWCGLNDEGRMMHRTLNGRSVLIEGHDEKDAKIASMAKFLSGQAQVMISKSRITGFGMNLQCASRVLFLGINDSWESFYQAVRRSWRFGQTQPVKVYVVVSDAEQVVLDNIQRKERNAETLMQEMIAVMRTYEQEELGSAAAVLEAHTEPSRVTETYALHHGDCVTVLGQEPENSVDFSVYSPPFISLYTYTDSLHDLGNCRSDAQFLEHFSYFTKALLRVTKPGRLTACHVAQVPAMLVRDQYIGLKDFRGKTIETFERNGWIFHGEVAIDKNPQAQAIRTKAKSLLFKQLRTDASWLRPALLDFVLVFRKPGENAVPILPDVSNDDWITWAHGVWYDIRESDTLRYMPARAERDERHVCPLQLSVIERAIRLWSNPGEVVLSPFMGIGSEGVTAIRTGRRFVGIELKDSYYRLAAQNISQEAEAQHAQMVMFA